MPLRSILAHATGIGEGQRHQVFGLELPHATGNTSVLAKCLMRVGSATIAYEQRGNRMPRMTLQITRRAMIARDNQYLRTELFDFWHRGIKLFDTRHLRIKVAIFPVLSVYLKCIKKKSYLDH